MLSSRENFPCALWSPATVHFLRSLDLLSLGLLLAMANKKKKAGSRRSQLTQHKSLAISQRNDSAVLALAAPPLTVHTTVTSNSNSKKRPPVASAAVCSRPIHHVLSSPQGSESHHPGDPSPSINQVFVEDWSSDEDLEEEEVDFDSSVDFDYVGAPSSSSPMVVASPALCQSTPPPPSLAEEILSPSAASPAGGQSTLPPQPLAVKILPTPLETTVLPSSLPSGCRESPPSTVAGASPMCRCHTCGFQRGCCVRSCSWTY
jgi:hypothetical protein